MNWLNKRWALSLVSRFVGIISWGLFTISTMVMQENTWSNTLIQLILIIATFAFIIIIPDKIIFQKYLVKKKFVNEQEKEQ